MKISMSAERILYSRPALLQQFLAKTEDMYCWRNAVITLIKIVDEKQIHYHALVVSTLPDTFLLLF